MEKGTHNQSEKRTGSPDDPSLQALFELASSRPVAPENDREQVRQSVYAEWQAVTGKRRLRRRVAGFSIAAAAILVISIMIRPFSATTPGIAPAELAQVQKVAGEVRVVESLAARSSAPLGEQMTVLEGQIIRTGIQSGTALRLANDISLRVDENTEIAMLGKELIRLNSGRVYVDTGAQTAADQRDSSENSLEIVTGRGAIRHIGTQYLVQLGTTELNVSVREGRVEVLDGGTEQLFVMAGQGLSLGDSGEKEIAPVDSHGPDWKWAEELGPGFDLDGRTMVEFLDWVAAETGFSVKYSSAQARSMAEDTVLHGQIELPARQALDVVLMSSDLSATIDEGIMEISLKP